MNQESQLFKALSDLREVRRAVDRVGHQERFPTAPSLKTHLTIHIICLFLACVFLALDTLCTPRLTDFLFATHHFEILRYISVFSILVTLFGLSATVYLLVWRAARRANEELSSFIGRNFRYLTVASFFSDLFIKFSAVSLVILAQRPDWVSAVLIACTGDYLIQGRGFILSVRTGMALGLSYLFAAVIVLIWFEGALASAFAALIIAILFSIIRIIGMLRLASSDEA